MFSEKDKLLELYNAMNQSNYTETEEIELYTLDNALYMGINNDVSFVMMSEFHFYEHQSTINPNLPLRNLFYISKTYQGLLDKKQLYRRTHIKIMPPHFVVFYNGKERMEEDERVLKLSDAFLVEGKADLELTVRVLNINKGHNSRLLESCQTLKEYMQFVSTVRRLYNQNIGLDNAVNRT